MLKMKVTRVRASAVLFCLEKRLSLVAKRVKIFAENNEFYVTQHLSKVSYSRAILSHQHHEVSFDRYHVITLKSAFLYNLYRGNLPRISSDLIAMRRYVKAVFVAERPYMTPLAYMRRI
jgi:hypothetical protein